MLFGEGRRTAEFGECVRTTRPAPLRHLHPATPRPAPCAVHAPGGALAPPTGSPRREDARGGLLGAYADESVSWEVAREARQPVGARPRAPLAAGSRPSCDTISSHAPSHLKGSAMPHPSPRSAPVRPAPLSRRALLAGVASLAATSSAALAGCGAGTSSAGSASDSEGPAIVIGTLPTEDLLPLWVAEQKGLFASYGLDATIESFDSAQNLSSAIVAGEVDVAMTDPMRAVNLCESGTEVTLEWVTLGTEASQGRFGVMTSPDSGIASLGDLAGCERGVGVGSNTVPEYVLHKLLDAAGIDRAEVPQTEVASLPERYTLMAEGTIDAAALPGSLLALGEANGMVLLADDTDGDNLSQSVMVARTDFTADDAGADALELLRDVWDEAAALVNDSPEDWRSLLVEKANLSDEVADTYAISTYPLSRDDDGEPLRPDADLIEPQLEWMASLGYSTYVAYYDATDGSLTVEETDDVTAVTGEDAEDTDEEVVIELDEDDLADE